MTRRARIAVTGAPSAVAFARDRVIAHIEAWGVRLGEEEQDAIKLVASELITNAVVHATGFVTVGLYLNEERLLLVGSSTTATPSRPGVRSPRRTTKGAAAWSWSSSSPHGTAGSRRTTARKSGRSSTYLCPRRPYTAECSLSFWGRTGERGRVRGAVLESAGQDGRSDRGRAEGGEQDDPGGRVARGGHGGRVSAGAVARRRWLRAAVRAFRLRQRDRAGHGVSADRRSPGRGCC